MFMSHDSAMRQMDADNEKQFDEIRNHCEAVKNYKKTKKKDALR